MEHFKTHIDKQTWFLPLRQTTKTKEVQRGWGGFNMFITLLVVMISLVYAYIQIHQFVHVKYVQLFVHQTYLMWLF